MDSPIAAVKSAFNLKMIIATLVVIMLLGIIFGALGLTNWLINPYGALVNKFPSLGKLNPSGGG